MDSDSEFENKKNKSSQSINFQVAECIRPFSLPKQFPSTLSEFRSSKLGSGKNMSATPRATVKKVSVSPISGNMTFIPNKEVSIPESIQKLKLKFPSGKDLGEVKILPAQGTKLQTQLKTLPHINQKVESLSTVTSSSNEVSNKPKIKTVTRIIDATSREIIEMSQRPSSNSTAGSLTDDGETVKKSKQYRSILPKPVTVDTFDSNNPLLARGFDNQMQKVLIIKTNDKNMQQKDILKKIDLKKLGGKQFVIMKDQSLSPKHSLEDMDKSSFKGLKRTILPNQNFQITKKLCIDNNVKSFKGNDRFVILSSEEDEDEDEDDLPIKYVHMPKGNIVIKKVSKEKSKLMNHVDFSENENFILEPVSSDLDEQNMDNPRLMNRNLEIDNSVTINGSSENNKVTASSDKIDILKKALLSVEDEKLREEALKALNECGLKVKKSVPIKHPAPRKLINESTTQTDVFFLLKEGQFIQVDEKNEGLLKMGYEQKGNSKMLDATKTLSNTKNIDDWKFDLDKLVDRINDDEAQKVQEVKKALEEKYVASAKILFKQLRFDFERNKNYDEDGFLGIHRAVLNDDFQQVQKNLIVLKACKLNVDIETQDYKTSLELALEFEVNPQIVKILLDAGAQPVSSKLRHDSALILAARKSSKILSELIKNINPSNRSLINAKDSEGLAAIHYCAQYGNLEGIVELLSHGAKVNLQDDKSGRTALFYAIENRNKEIPQETYNEIAHKLLEKGAISNIPIFSKHTVLSMIDDVKSHTLKIALNRAVR